MNEEAVNCKTIPIIGCDFNRDGVIDSADDEIIRILMFAREGDASYLEGADMNRDGIINSTDYSILCECLNINSATYNYPDINI